jgi:NAD(P)-dependent dehydrogenase (short-subunit alcohol dehydrogenase family)
VGWAALFWHLLATKAVEGAVGCRRNSIAEVYPESPEAVSYHRSQALGGRLTNIKDIAPLVDYLATQDKWITGQIIFCEWRRSGRRADKASKRRLHYALSGVFS